MPTSYYHTLIGHVISFCFLLVAGHQLGGTVLESGECREWPWDPAVIRVVRRKLRAAERAAYENQRARVVGYMRRILYSGGRLWLWREAWSDRESGGGYGTLGLGSVWRMGGGIYCAPRPAPARAAGSAVDARGLEQLAAGEEVVGVTHHKNQLSTLRRRRGLAQWRGVRCVQTTEKRRV